METLNGSPKKSGQSFFLLQRKGARKREDRFNNIKIHVAYLVVSYVTFATQNRQGWPIKCGMLCSRRGKKSLDVFIASFTRPRIQYGRPTLTINAYVINTRVFFFFN